MMVGPKLSLVRLLLTVTLLASATGCETTSHYVAAKMPFKKHQTPTRMVLLVAPSDTEDASYNIHQGIMCRAYFFAGKEGKPVPVKGDVVFTAYDRSKAKPIPEPDGLYSITDEKLGDHLRQDIVGDSYVFWLPFETPSRTQLMIQGELKLPDGTKVISSAVTMEMEPPAERGAHANKSKIRKYQKTFARTPLPSTPVADNPSANEDQKTLGRQVVIDPAYSITEGSGLQSN